jgi:hypothetical protein
MIRDYRLPDNRVEELYLQCEEVLFGSLLGDSPAEKMEHFKRKIAFLRATKSYRLINICISQLMEVVQAHFSDDDEREKETKGVWMPYLV